MLLAVVPQGDGELAAQLLEHPFAVLFPQVRDELGVAVRAEPMALAPRVRPCTSG